MNPNLRLLELIREHIGTREEGDNRGDLIDVWNKFNGVPLGSPWCLSMIQYFIAQVDYELGTKAKTYKTASVIELAHKYHNMTLEPEVGHLVLWQMYSKSGVPTRAGHIGVVSQVISKDVILSIEGNTRGVHDGVIDREGKEVVEQRRVLDRNKGIMRFLGCINPWGGK